MLSGSQTPQLLLLGGMALACFLLLRGSWRYFAAGARGSRASNPADEVRRLLGNATRPQPLIDAPDQVLLWQVELHEIVRDAKAEIDTKLLALQHLSREVRQAEDRLARLLARAEALVPAGEPLADQLAELASLPPAERAASLGQAHRQTSQAALGQLDSAQQRAAAELFAQGAAVAEIARRLGLPQGEVELLLSLSAQ